MFVLEKRLFPAVEALERLRVEHRARRPVTEVFPVEAKHALRVFVYDVKVVGNENHRKSLVLLEVIEHLVNESVSTRGASLSIATIQGYCDGGLVYFFQFCKIVKHFKFF